MPKKKNIDEVVNDASADVSGVVNEFVRRRRQQYEDAANRLREGMREDLKRFSSLLEDGKITAADFEHLARGRAAQLKIELLSEFSISKGKFDSVSDKLVGILIKSIFSAINTI